MVIDSSALLAILLGEPEEEEFLRSILASPTRLISAVTLLETSIVLRARKGPGGTDALQELLSVCGVTVVPFDAEQVELALQAHGHFGKGNHPARLNLGDCCAYALAKASAEPLPFKGDDFRKTDVIAVR